MREIAEYVERKMCTDTQLTIENEENFVTPMPEYDEDATVLTKAIQ